MRVRRSDSAKRSSRKSCSPTDAKTRFAVVSSGPTRRGRIRDSPERVARPFIFIMSALYIRVVARR
jgi:hypothetical protein